MSRTLSTAGLVAIWFLLLILLTLTVASAYIPMGMANTMVNLLIATAKAVLVMVFFMHLRTGSTTVRLMASTGLLWLGLLITLSLADNLTRHPVPPPW